MSVIAKISGTPHSEHNKRYLKVKILLQRWRCINISKVNGNENLINFITGNISYGKKLKDCSEVNCVSG